METKNKINLTFVVPAYNEAENIEAMVADALRALNAMAETYEIVVVDDGSSDDTAERVNALIAANPNVRLIRHEQNQGYGAAVFTGLTNGSMDLIFFTDSDRQFDLEELRGLLGAIDEYDLVVGYRSPRRDPLMRRLNGYGWSGLVTLFFGYTARDIDCAFKLMRREVFDRVKNRIQSRGATFSAEFLVRVKRSGFKIRELPIRGHRPRVAGSPTGARPDVVLRAFKELILLRFRLWGEGAHGSA